MGQTVFSLFQSHVHLCMDNKVHLVERQLETVKSCINDMDKKLKLLDQQADTGFPTSDITKDLQHEVGRLEKENNPTTQAVVRIRVSGSKGAGQNQ